MDNLDPGLSTLSSELLSAISVYLSNPEYQQLDQVCSSLRSFFLPLSFKKCMIANLRDFQTGFFKQQDSSQLFSRDFPLNERVLPPRVFLNPEKYSSWFLKEYVISIRFMKMEFPWGGTNDKPLPEFVEPYAGLKYLGFYENHSIDRYDSWLTASFLRCKNTRLSHSPTTTEKKIPFHVTDYLVSKSSNDNNQSSGYLDYNHAWDPPFLTARPSSFVFEPTATVEIIKRLTLNLCNFKIDNIPEVLSMSSIPEDEDGKGEAIDLLPHLPNLTSLALLVDFFRYEAAFNSILKTVKKRIEAKQLEKLNDFSLTFECIGDDLSSLESVVGTIGTISYPFKRYHLQLMNRSPKFQAILKTILERSGGGGFSHLTSFHATDYMFFTFPSCMFDKLTNVRLEVNIERLKSLKCSHVYTTVKRLEVDDLTFHLLQPFPNVTELHFHGNGSYCLSEQRGCMQQNVQLVIYLFYTKYLEHYGFGNFDLNDRVFLTKVAEEIRAELEDVENEYEKISPFCYEKQEDLCPEYSDIEIVANMFHPYWEFEDFETKDMRAILTGFETILKSLRKLEHLSIDHLGEFYSFFSLHKLIRHHPKLKSVGFQGRVSMLPLHVEKVRPNPKDDFYDKMIGSYTRVFDRTKGNLREMDGDLDLDFDRDFRYVDPESVREDKISKLYYHIDLEGMRHNHITGERLNKDYVSLAGGFSGIYCKRNKGFRYTTLLEPGFLTRPYYSGQHYTIPY